MLRILLLVLVLIINPSIHSVDAALQFTRPTASSPSPVTKAARTMGVLRRSTSRNSLLPTFFKTKSADPALCSTAGGGVAAPLPDDDESKPSNAAGSWSWSVWKERLSKISNIASLLCVIDCTVLPIVTLALPLIGVAASPEQAKWLHELGHAVALFFVLPVGGLAATMNFLSHKKATISVWAVIGLSLIYAANGHGGPLLSMLPHDLAHSLHCGTILHRTVNIVGCACLLGSNYVSHRMGCSHNHGDGAACSHGHHHH